MKKKIVLAVLAMCMVLTVGGCGSSAKDTDTIAEKETSDEAETTEEQEDTKADEQKKSEATRLVRVKDIDKYVTIGEYKGIKLNNTIEAVTDDQVEMQIEYELEDKAEEVTDKNGTVQTGDLVTIDFVGLLDGETFDGGTATNYDLTVGEGGMIDGFEDGIIGMKKGETKEVPLTFPEDYFSEDMAGKDVVFKITLQNFRRAPELTDEWVAQNTDYSTIDEYKAGIRALLEKDAEEAARYNMYSDGWNQVLESSEIIEFPEEDINDCIAEFKRQVESYADQAGMELLEFVESQGYTEESFEDECRQYAEYKVKQNLIVQGIMDAEGIRLDDEECLAIQDELIQNYGKQSLADLVDEYGQVAVDESIGLLRVEHFIVENAEITELTSEGDQVGVNGDIQDSSVDEEETIEDAPEAENADAPENSGEDEITTAEEGEEES